MRSSFTDRVVCPTRIRSASGAATSSRAAAVVEASMSGDLDRRSVTALMFAAAREWVHEPERHERGDTEPGGDEQRRDAQQLDKEPEHERRERLYRARGRAEQAGPLAVSHRAEYCQRDGAARDRQQPVP